MIMTVLDSYDKVLDGYDKVLDDYDKVLDGYDKVLDGYDNMYGVWWFWTQVFVSLQYLNVRQHNKAILAIQWSTLNKRTETKSKYEYIMVISNVIVIGHIVKTTVDWFCSVCSQSTKVAQIKHQQVARLQR